MMVKYMTDIKTLEDFNKYYEANNGRFSKIHITPNVILTVTIRDGVIVVSRDWWENLLHTGDYTAKDFRRLYTVRIYRGRGPYKGTVRAKVIIEKGIRYREDRKGNLKQIKAKTTIQFDSVKEAYDFMML